MGILTEKSHFCALSVIFLRLVCILKLEGVFKDMLSGKTKWRVMSTFWHKLSDLRLVISNLYGDIDRKITFLCPLRYIFEASVHFKVGRCLQGYVKWKNSMTIMSTFWHKMSDLKPVCSIKMWKLTEKSHFCALSVIFLRLVCISKLEGVLQGYVKWKNSMTIYVNFLTQNVGSETSLLD